VAFRWLCPIEKQSVTNALSANSLRFAQICNSAMCLFNDFTPSPMDTLYNKGYETIDVTKDNMEEQINQIVTHLTQKMNI
ncbi:hypothetical protein, partial [uncultured Alistipes sp.]|uniref:hypothetical protein n=1 Tax=uncultured Alistipes sp. TaxID=538949 RepID=UPI0026EFFCAD